LTWTYELDLDILKKYLQTRNEVFRSRLVKVRTQTGQTERDRQTDAIEHITTTAFAGGKKQ